MKILIFCAKGSHFTLFIISVFFTSGPPTPTNPLHNVHSCFTGIESCISKSHNPHLNTHHKVNC